jgi:hypothetical protein
MKAAIKRIAPQPLRWLLLARKSGTHPDRNRQEVLGRTLWAKQAAVCQAVAHSPVTVVPAGRAVGKSFLLAGLVLWWLYTRPNSLVITTGPDHRQVVSVLWKELRRALRSARLPLGYDQPMVGCASLRDADPPYVGSLSFLRGAI